MSLQLNLAKWPVILFFWRGQSLFAEVKQAVCQENIIMAYFRVFKQETNVGEVRRVYVDIKIHDV